MAILKYIVKPDDVWGPYDTENRVERYAPISNVKSNEIKPETNLGFDDGFDITKF